MNKFSFGVKNSIIDSRVRLKHVVGIEIMEFVHSEMHRKEAVNGMNVKVILQWRSKGLF